MKKGMLIVCLAIAFAFGGIASAQTSEFACQGRLLRAGVPSTGSVDFEFRLFDDVAVGTQVGPTVSLSAVSVNNGVFSVRLDFGNQFPGANRFLEIRVRQVTDDFFTVLTPRQSITSAPYSIKSLTADSATNATAATNALGNNAAVGSASLTFATAIGAGSTVTTSNTIQLGRPNDRVRISGLGTAGSQSLCSNSNNEISTCSSSIRYKSNIHVFSSGLDLIRRLRPVTFQWKESGMADLGLLAEEVNKVEPVLTTTNDKGEIEGVKYNQLSAVFINAFKEQQAQIEKLEKQIAAQQTQIKALTRHVSLRSGRTPARRTK